MNKKIKNVFLVSFMLIFLDANASSAVVLKTLKDISPQTAQALYGAAVVSTMVAIERIDYYLRDLCHAHKKAVDQSVLVPSSLPTSVITSVPASAVVSTVTENPSAVTVPSDSGFQKFMNGVARNIIIPIGAVVALTHYGYRNL